MVSTLKALKLSPWCLWTICKLLAVHEPLDSVDLVVFSEDLSFMHMIFSRIYLIHT